MRWNEIFKESQLLNELFDRIADWQWTHVDEFNRNAKFNVNGTNYSMDIWSQPGEDVWAAEFKNMNVWTSRWGNVGNMDNEAIQVFGTVIAILKKFLDEVKPKALHFEGYVDEKRDQLYSKMIQHEMGDIRKQGYKVDATHLGSHIEFMFLRQAETSNKETDA